MNHVKELSSCFVSLYCEDDELWGDLICSEDVYLSQSEQDLFWDDEELQFLFRKEKETWPKSRPSAVSVPVGRKEAVKWILKVNVHYGFSALTAILAVNYLDRFLTSLDDLNKPPWMIQLAAVACLSLAAKVEETRVPLLLDLQGVKGSEYVFEVETVERMELLVLSSLKWRMNAATPLSFLDHIIRRVRGMNIHRKESLLSSCENLLLSFISDSRFINYRPSVVATASLIHVIHGFDDSTAASDSDSAAFKNHLLITLLQTSKEEAGECCQVISDVLISSKNHPQKRKFCPVSTISSPSPPPSTQSQQQEQKHGSLKRIRRVEEQRMKLGSVASRVLVKAVGNGGCPPH